MRKHSHSKNSERASNLRKGLFAAKKRNTHRGFFESFGESSFYMTTDEMETSLSARECAELVRFAD